MDAEKKNYYEVLDVDPSATPATIENAYVRARNAYSGDSVALYSLMTKAECDAVLEQIEEAYSVLGFPEKRKEYDRLRGFNRNGISTPAASVSDVLSNPETRRGDANIYEDYSTNKMEAKVSKITAQKKFGLDFVESPEMERKILQAVEFTGPFLKEIREYKNVSIERMAEMTRISKTHINAVENEDLSRLPAEVYVRGFVYQVAKVLKLNPEQVATSYMLYFKKLKTK